MNHWFTWVSSWHAVSFEQKPRNVFAKFSISLESRTTTLMRVAEENLNEYVSLTDKLSWRQGRSVNWLWRFVHRRLSKWRPLGLFVARWRTSNWELRSEPEDIFPDIRDETINYETFRTRRFKQFFRWKMILFYGRHFLLVNILFTSMNLFSFEQWRIESNFKWLFEISNPL